MTRPSLRLKLTAVVLAIASVASLAALVPPV